MNEARSTDFGIGHCVEAPSAAVWHGGSVLAAEDRRHGDGGDEPSVHSEPASRSTSHLRGDAWQEEGPSAEDGGAAKALAGLVADEHAHERSHDLGADLSRLTPLVVEHQAQLTGEPSPLAGSDVQAQDSAASPGVPKQAKLGDRLANAILGLFVVGLTAFLAGAGLATAVLLGHLKTSWVKEMLGHLKDIAMQLSNLM